MAEGEQEEEQHQEVEVAEEPIIQSPDDLHNNSERIEMMEQGTQTDDVESDTIEKQLEKNLRSENRGV